MRQRVARFTGVCSSFGFCVNLSLVAIVCFLTFVGGADWKVEWRRRCPVEDGFFLCRNRTACIRPDRLCDGMAHCPDGSDESLRCRVDCNRSCLGACQRRPTGPVCRRCPPGLRPDPRNNSTCIDINECLYEPPVCSQSCNNTSPGFSCSCVDGYRLQDDLLHCSALSWKIDAPYLVYTQTNAIYSVSVKPGSTAIPRVVHRTRGVISALAVDAIEELIYYYDMTERCVSRINFDGSNNQKFVTNGLSLVHGLAVDWLARNLYILDAGMHQIVVCTLRSENRTCASLNIGTGFGTLASVDVDPKNGKLYWTECGPDARKRRIVGASLDGTNAKSLVTERLRCSSGIHVDLTRQMLYWAEADFHLIESTRTDGSNRMNISSSSMGHPIGLGVFEENLYWSDYENNNFSPRSRILMASKFLSNDRHPKTVLAQLQEVATELKVFHAALQMPASCPCDRARCSDVCLLNDRSSYTCACSKGRTIGPDKHTCTDSSNEQSLLIANKNHIRRLVPDAVGLDITKRIVAVAANITSLAIDVATQNVYFATSPVPSGHSKRSGTINRINLADAGKMEIVVDGVDDVSGLSIDWIARNVYWVDRERGTVEVVRFDGQFRTVLIAGSKEGNRLPRSVRAIAVDPIQRHLYYSDCSRKFPHIGICDLAAKSCLTTSFHVAMTCVTSLVVDQREQRVYWTDSHRGLILSADIHGQDVRPLRHSLEPISVAVFADRVFWTDLHFPDVLYQRKAHATERHKIAVGLTPLTAVIAIESDAQPAGAQNICSQSNGGCTHLCVPSADGQPACLCPVPLRLQKDRKSCVSADDKKPVNGPIFITRPPTTTPRRQILGRPRSRCYDDYCFFGGTCFVEAERVICLCVDGRTGSRCETLQLLATSSSHAGAWVAGIVGVFAAVAVALVAILGVFYRQGHLKRTSLADLKSVIYGRFRRDEDDPKTALVDPTYENPGYEEIDDDEIGDKPGKMKETVRQSGGSVYATRKEYPIIKKLDTADP